jgi:uncharacterized repeat protein (TIGR01451 family)
MSLPSRAAAVVVGSIVSWGAHAGTASAQAPPIALQSVASGLSTVVAITNARDGSGRLFFTLQSGQVRIYDGCQLLVTPFLDVSSLIVSGGEQGLLSIAFHPNFPATPYFYVYYTRSADGAIVIARYRVQAGNPNLADTSTAVILRVIPHPTNTNHNGGQLQFGPDGYLYIGTGDGGGGNDVPCNAQNDSVLLGKILRIDVNQSFNVSPYYGIPPTNPVFGAGPRDEKWAKGVRNPWRFSFDRSTGDLIIGDVGQGAREEVDLHPAASAGGQNWGWRMMEGTICTPGTSNVGCQVGTPACNDLSLLPPVFDYSHSSGRCSITGGYRYRGTQVAGLAGYYVYGDYCSGEIFAANNPGGVWSSGTAAPLLDNAFNITTFGEDEAGELYVTGNGTVYRIVGAAPQNADLSITKTDGQTTATAGGPITYTITAGNSGPYTARSATVADTFPATLQNVNWTCSASPGSSCCSITGGNTAINRPVMIVPGGTVTFTATATISASATGTLSNTATVTAPASVTDAAMGNNSSTDTDTLTTPTDLAITKTDGQTTAAPGQVRTYTIVATNLGPAPATGATVTDTVPAALTGATWTCTGANGGTCGNASGGPNIAETVNLPVGGSVTYTLTGTVGPNPSNLRNTATVAIPAAMSDSNPANNSATDDDALICVSQMIVVPDGRLTQSTIGAGAQAWFAASLRIGNSYSVEFKNRSGDSTPPGTLTLYSGDDGCSGSTTMTPRDTTAIDPGAGLASRRLSFTATGTGTLFRAMLDNTGGPLIPLSFSWSDTTLFSPAWSTNGNYNTYYSLQNTTGLAIGGTLTLRDAAGVVLTTSNVSIPAGQTVSTNTASLGTARNRTGTAKFTHDGPPGAVIVEAAIANFSLSPAYVQPVKFQAMREAK